jgi:type IV pilus assembly protein PilA
MLWRRAFTLVELMIVVVIVGILSAVAVPSFVRYMRRAKTAEAVSHIHMIFQGALAYYGAERADRFGQMLPARFPDSAGPTPARADIGASKRQPVPAEWETSTWIALQFAVTNPHYYAYQFSSEGTFRTARFTAAAFGDLDGDREYSTFLRIGTVRDGAIAGGEGYYFANELE